MEKIREHDELKLSVVATGMHLSPQYGNTYKEIEKDGFEIDHKVDMLIDADTGLSMAKSTGIGMMGMAVAFRNIEPDIVLILGDRDEPLAAAIAAAHMNIPVAHIHGGDVMVGAIIDDSIRYALTKFSHIHFPASEESAERILNLGEEEWRVRISGAPGLDAILQDDYIPGTEVRGELGVGEDENLILCVQHPVTTQSEKAGDQMEMTLDALGNIDAHIVLIYPNSDAGGKEMIQVLEDHPIQDDLISFRNLPREKYLGLMDAADVMVGNSSSGIIEATSFDLPVVDIGPREARRQRAENVVSVPHETEAILEAVEDGLYDEDFRETARVSENPYDYGGAGERIANFLTEVSINENLLRKNITY
jgi:UDP-N-acetylglucosamine 2-epimerase (non-hydrolysing)/GDP/UDP-N,N'-diacetylbacillosamine 2-epimerase (hydrolysing)